VTRRGTPRPPMRWLLIGGPHANPHGQIAPAALRSPRKRQSRATAPERTRFWGQAVIVYHLTLSNDWALYLLRQDRSVPRMQPAVAGPDSEGTVVVGRQELIDAYRPIFLDRRRSLLDISPDRLAQLRSVSDETAGGTCLAHSIAVAGAGGVFDGIEATAGSAFGAGLVAAAAALAIAGSRRGRMFRAGLAHNRRPDPGRLEWTRRPRPSPRIRQSTTSLGGQLHGARAARSVLHDD
jgi:hypothetical protein